MPLPEKVTNHKVRTPIAFVDIEDALLRDRFHLDLKGPLAITCNWRAMSLGVFRFLVANPVGGAA